MGGCLSTDVQTKYATGGVTTSGNSGGGNSREAANATALVTGSLAYSSWVEVQVSCTNLKSADTFSRSDPMAILTEMTPYGWIEVGRTEVVSNNESPMFVKKFRMLYNFEAVQQYKLAIVDVDKKHTRPDIVDVKSCNYLGDVDFRLSEVVTAGNRALTLDVQHTSRPSKVHLIAEEMSSAREIITMQLSASGLRNLEYISKSDPFLEISRITEQGQWLPVFKTEVVDNNLNPVWAPFTVKATQLNNGDAYRTLRLRVYDYENNGRHRLIGEVDASAVKLKELVDAGSLQLTHPQKGSAGHLEVRSFNVEVRPSFLDYLQAGAEMNFIVAVDYTASNKDPRDPTSLHYLNPSGSPTLYEEAIVGIARVLEAYDHDNIFQCYGFGGRHPQGTVSHCTPLGDNSNGDVDGIQGLLTAYRQTFHHWVLSGPTLFTPLLRQTVAIASQTTGRCCYHVLLILTDGCIHDMQDTIDAIVAASHLPLSILIVGIGESPELSKMEMLDADEKRLVDFRGRAAVRDTVQFVKFSQHRNNGLSLATELLAELPGQFLEWARAENIPLPTPATRGPPGQPTVQVPTSQPPTPAGSSAPSPGFYPPGSQLPSPAGNGYSLSAPGRP